MGLGSQRRLRRAAVIRQKGSPECRDGTRPSREIIGTRSVTSPVGGGGGGRRGGGERGACGGYREVEILKFNEFHMVGQMNRRVWIVCTLQWLWANVSKFAVMLDVKWWICYSFIINCLSNYRLGVDNNQLQGDVMKQTFTDDNLRWDELRLYSPWWESSQTLCSWNICNVNQLNS